MPNQRPNVGELRPTSGEGVVLSMRAGLLPMSVIDTSGRPAMMHDATMERRWGEITLTMVEVQIRSGLSVPVELGGGPIGTLDVYAAAPGGWDATEVSALQTYAGLVATLLGTAATAQVKASAEKAQAQASNPFGSISEMFKTRIASTSPR